MPASVIRVPVWTVPRESMLYYAWRTYNRLVTKLDGHVHTGVGTTTPVNTAAVAAPPAAVERIADPEGRSLRTGSTQTDSPATGITRVASSSGGPDSLIAAIGEGINRMLDQITSHVHTAQSGAANTAALSLGGTNIPQKIADAGTRDVLTGAVVAASANTGAPVEVPVRGRGFADDLAQIVSSLNAIIQWLDNHVHGGVTAGAGSTSAFSFTTAVFKIADLNGHGPDGETVT